MDEILRGEYSNKSYWQEPLLLALQGGWNPIVVTTATTTFFQHWLLICLPRNESPWSVQKKLTTSEMRLWKLLNASKVEGVVQFFMAIWYRKNRRILKLFTEVYYSQTSRSSAGERQRPTLIKRNWRENFFNQSKRAIHSSPLIIGLQCKD